MAAGLETQEAGAVFVTNIYSCPAHSPLWPGPLLRAEDTKTNNADTRGAPSLEGGSEGQTAGQRSGINVTMGTN